MSSIADQWIRAAGNPRSSWCRAKWNGIVAWLSALLKRGEGGTLLHTAAGEIASGCGKSGSCGCISSDHPCANCPDATPAQFHVTFLGVTPCVECTGCDAAGASVSISDCSIDGTYVLTQNGDCAWTALASTAPCSGQLYSSTDCSGDFQPLSFAIQLVRISGAQFELQITDDSQQILIFNATVAAASCCGPDATTIGNQVPGCDCDTSGEAIIIGVGAGGAATVTPC